jgi:hypothetical protein
MGRPALPEAFERFCGKWAAIRALPAPALMSGLNHALDGVDALVEAIMLQKTLGGAAGDARRRRL